MPDGITHNGSLLERRGFQAGNIGVLGVSMGAAAAIGAASEDDRIGALVADSSFAELAPLVEEYWTATTHLPSFVMSFTDWIGKHGFGCDIDSARPTDEIGMVAGAILLIHADGDRVTPMRHSMRLKQSAGCRAELWIGHPNEHAGLYLADPGAYLNKVTSFLDAHLNGGG